MTGAKVEFCNVTGKYGTFTALHPTDLTIEAGEFFALLGPSGSGKSTLLGAISGFVQPSEGRVLVNGQDLTVLPPSRRNIGMVFQNYSLFPFMTVAQNVAFPLENRGVRKPEIETRVKRALDMVRMSKMADRLPRQLSGGQQQRVALARAFVYNPPLLLMDEPLGALDKNLREEMQDEIKELHRSIGATIVYVTHDQYEAAAMADRVAIMNHGRLEQVGVPHDLYENPRNSFIASFLGEANVFAISGSVLRSVGNTAVEFKTATGLNIAATPSGYDASGDQVAIVRPESIRLTDDPTTCRNSLRGKVTDAVHATGIIRYRIRVEDGSHVVARVSANRKTSAKTIGDDVHVGWDAEDTKLVPAST